MEGELYHLTLVWISAVTSLCYCYYMIQYATVGTKRLLSVFPVVILFLLLPLNLTTISLGGLSTFFLAWLANFKLLLLAFGKGPLSSPDLSLPYFVATACLPIKLDLSGAGGLKSPLNYAAKCLLLAALFPLYKKKDEIHPNLLMLMYAIHMYIGLEVSLAAIGAAAQQLVGAQLEPQFNEPYLSTSLQDFWGRRWNLMVTSILRPSVYDPVRSISIRLIGRRWSSLPAAFSTFLVSALMHELVFYYIGRKKPTWLVTYFFILHGVSVGAEILMKKAVRWRLPAAVSCPLTVAYVAVTGLWLFFPALLRCDAEAKAWRETVAVVEFVKGMWTANNHHGFIK